MGTATPTASGPSDVYHSGPVKRRKLDVSTAAASSISSTSVASAALSTASAHLTTPTELLHRELHASIVEVCGNSHIADRIAAAAVQSGPLRAQFLSQARADATKCKM